MLDTNQQDTFKPIDVSEDRDELGNTVDPVDTINVEGFTFVPYEDEDEEDDEVEEVIEEEDEDEDEAIEVPGFTFVPYEKEEVEEEIKVEGFTFIPYEEQESDIASPSTELTTVEPIETPDDQSASNDIKALAIPEGWEAGEYTPDDLSKREFLDVIEPFLKDRYGDGVLDDLSDKETADLFLSNRRGNAMAGHSLKVLTEANYISGIKDSREKLLTAGKAYSLYENMQGITGDDYSWGELGAATWDIVKDVALDPLTWASGFFGRAVSGSATMAGAKILEKSVTSMVMKELGKGVSKEVVKKRSAQIMNNAVAHSTQLQTQALATFTTQVQKKALNKLATQNTLKEIAGTVAFDSVAGMGSELLYQNTLVDTGVQEQVDKRAVGLAALGSLVIGAGSAVRTATRGWSDTTMVDQVLKNGTKEEVASSFAKSFKGYFEDLSRDKLDETTSWGRKVKNGEETYLNVDDTEFFIDLLLGVSKKSPDGSGDYDVAFKGLAQSMQELGMYYMKRSDDDTISNFFADFMKTELKQEDITSLIQGLEKSTGLKVTGFTDKNGVPLKDLKKPRKYPTPTEFSAAFAKKINSQARGLNSIAQGARKLDVDVSDMDMDQYLTAAIGERIGVALKGDEYSSSIFGKAANTVTAGQNRYIKLLVSHPGTTWMNVVGYGSTSAIGSASDLLRATMLGGAGSVADVFSKGAGTEMKHVAHGLAMSNLNRVKLLLDPEMTKAAYLSAVNRSTGALDTLARTQSGGVDADFAIGKVINRSKAGKITDDFVDLSQMVTLVEAQDIFTKSQEYVFQMDKMLRIAYGKSYNEFYKGPKAAELMFSKKYKQIELDAVTKVQQATFSESFKDSKTVLGGVAGVIENMRKLPGVGTMIPFGKFFNNTIAFTARNTPGLNMVAKATTGNLQKDTYSDLFTRSVVVGGMLTYFASDYQDRRKQGLDIYQTREDGEVMNHEFEYPISLLMGVGAIMSYRGTGEAPPSDLIERVVEDFGVGGLTRGLSKSSNDLLEGVKYAVAGDYEEAGNELSDVLKALGGQVVSGMTRPFQPADEIFGVFSSTEMRPTVAAEGDRMFGRSLTYINNMHQLLTGTDERPIKYDIAGPAQIQSGTVVGKRPMMLTETGRLLNLLGREGWKEGATSRQRKLAPVASNAYEKLLHRRIERVALNLMKDEVFLNKTQEAQNQEWDLIMEDMKEQSRNTLASNFQGDGQTLSNQFEITRLYSASTIRAAISEIGLDGDLGELSLVQIKNLKTKLETQKILDSEEAKLGASRIRVQNR